MAELIGIVGGPGTGKSSSILPNEELDIKGLNPKKTVLINIAGKGLPMKGWKKFYTEFEGKTGNFRVSDNSEDIVKMLEYIDNNRPDIINIVLDDSQYIMGFEYMDKALRQDWFKFNEIGKHMFDIFKKARTLRSDIKVFILTHSDEIQQDLVTVRKMKTVGKLLDNSIDLEGMFTVDLYTNVLWHRKEQKSEYRFVTNKTEDYPAKSPYGMFKDLYIPNDLGFVSDKVDEFYNG